MTPINSHRPGYKHTPIGWIPEEWDAVIISSIATTFSGGTPSRDNKEYYQGNIPWLKSGDLNQGYVSDASEYISEDALNDSSAKIVEEGTLLLALYGATAGVSAITNIKASINQAILAINVDKNVVDCNFINNWIINNKNNIINTYCQGGQPNLNADIVNSLPIPLPPLPEQKKIAEVLGTWDRAIEAETKLITAKKKRKKALMQQLLTGKKRLHGYSAEWKSEEIGSYFEENISKTKVQDEYPVLTSSRNGLMAQSDYYDTDRIIGKDNIGFNVIPPKYITYRSRSDDGNFTFNQNDLGYTGIVSKYYPVFKVINGDSNFILYIINFNISEVRKYSVGTSQLVLSFSDLQKVIFNFPSLEEQQAIASVLQTVDKEIALLEKRLEALREQKKGLMQKLLTGEVRVKVS